MGSDSVSGEFFGPVVRKNQFCGSLFKYGPKPIQANEILSSFDVGLRQYATNHLTKSGVSLMRGVVKEVHAKKIVLNHGTDVPYGLLVWSTGVGPSKFVKSLDLPKSPGGRIGVDGWMRVPSVEDVFALGDCAGFLEETVPSVEDVFALGDYVIRTC